MFFGGAGGRQRRQGPERGSDIRYDLEISFEEAAFGVEREIVIPRVEKCHECHGSGAAPGSKPETCPKCHGSGQMRQSVKTMFGMMQNITTCDRCHGTGKIVKNPCTSCHGTGKESVTSKINVNIPAGIDNGQRVRLRGEGETGSRGGASGDLYVYVFIKPHKIFRRDGNDVLVEVPISFVQAALGDQIEVPTLDGKVEIKVPAGLQSGTILRVRGKGIPRLRGSGRGDEHVKVKVLTPQKLNDKQKEALRKFGELCGENVNPEQKSFADKLKDLFKN